MRIGRQTAEKRSPGRALLHRWPFLLAALLLGALLGAAVLLARPPVYQAEATVVLEPQRYDFAVQLANGGWVVPAELTAEVETLLALHAPADLSTHRLIGRPVEFTALDDSTLLATGRAVDPERAQEIADHAGTALVDGIRSAYGWNLMHTLLRRAIYLQGQGQEEPSSPLMPHLFALLDAGFLRYDPAIAVPTDAPRLSLQDVLDVTLAVERMWDRLTSQIDTRFERLNQAQTPAEQSEIAAELANLRGQREVLGETLLTLYRQRSDLVEGEEAENAPEKALLSEAHGLGGLPRWFYLLAGVGAGLLSGAGLGLLDERFGLAGRLREVLTYRDLIWNLVLRDLKARYKSSVLGYLWSLVNPLLMMSVFTILFKFLLKSDIPSFPVFIIVALLPWNYCASSVSGAVTSITGQSSLIKKVYFPREVIPIALVLANLINFLLALPAMIAIMLLLNAHFQPVALLFPLIVLVQTIFVLGLALFLSCLNVFFRDTQVIMEVFLTAWFFLTPVFYRLSDIVDERLARLVRWLNPMASLVDFYRDIFYLGGLPGWDAIARTLVTALLVLLGGYLFFLRLSPRFGEEI